MDGWMGGWMMDGWMEGGLPAEVLASQGTLTPEEWRESSLEFETLVLLQPCPSCWIELLGPYIISCGPSGLQDQTCESEL